MAEAALGTSIEVPLIEGGTERVDLDAGTQPGTVIRMARHGMPRLRRRGHGDLYVVVAVEVPEALSDDEAELLRRYAELRGEEPRAAKRRRRRRSADVSRTPHVVVLPPWEEPRLTPSDATRRHLESVLRLRPEAAITYTDGAGTLGRGHLDAGTLVRGHEETEAPPTPLLTLAVAPPRAAHRLRFLVEKCTELEVNRLIWLRTRRGEGRSPKPAKAAAWAVAALEQSSGTWLPSIDPSPATPDSLDGLGRVVVADPTAAAPPSTAGTGPVVVLIGPEGRQRLTEIGSGTDLLDDPV